jgi:hypothetical protein
LINIDIYEAIVTFHNQKDIIKILIKILIL